VVAAIRLRGDVGRAGRHLSDHPIGWQTQPGLARRFGGNKMKMIDIVIQKATNYQRLNNMKYDMFFRIRPDSCILINELKIDTLFENYIYTSIKDDAIGSDQVFLFNQNILKFWWSYIRLLCDTNKMVNLPDYTIFNKHKHIVRQKFTNWLIRNYKKDNDDIVKIPLVGLYIGDVLSEKLLNLNINKIGNNLNYNFNNETMKKLIISMVKNINIKLTDIFYIYSKNNKGQKKIKHEFIIPYKIEKYPSKPDEIVKMTKGDIDKNNNFEKVIQSNNKVVSYVINNIFNKHKDEGIKNLEKKIKKLEFKFQKTYDGMSHARE
jgi:hypothetical protein